MGKRKHPKVIIGGKFYKILISQTGDSCGKCAFWGNDCICKYPGCSLIYGCYFKESKTGNV